MSKLDQNIIGRNNIFANLSCIILVHNDIILLYNINDTDYSVIFLLHIYNYTHIIEILTKF